MGEYQVKKQKVSEPLENIHSISEIEIHYKKPKLQIPKLDNPNNVYFAFLKIWSKGIEHREEAYTLFADNALNPIGFYNVGKGGITACTIDPKLILQIALKVNASFVFLAHNHPSGSLKPSASDIQLTVDLAQKGRFLGVGIKDHLIINTKDYYSFVLNKFI